MQTQRYMCSNDIRGQFSQAMSKMYQAEVPLYGDLLDIVADINHNYIQQHPETTLNTGHMDRICAEKHGAIRLGTAEEMHHMARLFAVMDMHPVGYYDLTVANIPVHSTAFRPITKEALAANPFRIFCSLLRLDLLPPEIRNAAEKQLATRHIFNDNILILIGKAEEQGGLTESDAKRFIGEAVNIFKWHKHAAISQNFYKQLLAQNALVADIVGFKGPHINHLTPRILDIDQLHQHMLDQGIAMIPTIQGPPKRKCDILLRQTSFQALNETVLFTEQNDDYEEGTHRARFGEIEQRGIALTPKGRALYDRLLNNVLAQTNEKEANYRNILESIFSEFPDSYHELRRNQLAYFEYHIHHEKLNSLTLSSDESAPLETLIEIGVIYTTPITYEDFLPVSAAGIFKSNLVEGGEVKTEKLLDYEHKLTSAIGRKPLDPFSLYEQQQKTSIAECEKTLQHKLK